MKVIVGLGNPGADYLNTRHNVGMMVVDRLAERLVEKEGGKGYGWRKEGRVVVNKLESAWLIKSGNVFMNESGELIRPLSGDLRSKEWELWLVHDDLDIKLGEYKIQYSKGPKDHGGINSVEGVMKGKDFWRVRVGVDNRDPAVRVAGDEYVLQKFLLAEKEIIDGVVERVVEDLMERV